MRIRSIRPEFWRSDDITALNIEDRLLFIGLWSYVDDNGVGLDKLADVTADLFAADLEDNPRETFARVSRGLQTLSAAFLITRYSVDDKAYLHIANWSKHQKIDRPGKSRYPLPTSENAVIRETLATLSRESRETPSTGEGEKGRRGEGEKERAPAKPDAPKSPEQIATTNAYERVGKAFKYVAVLQIAKWAIHDRGENENTVEDAIVAIYQMGKPITRQLVGQYLDGHLTPAFTRPTQPPPGGTSKQDAKVIGYLDAAQRITANRTADEPRELM